MGIIGSLAHIHILCKLHNLLGGSITVTLDCQEAMHSVSKDYEPNATQVDYDLILAIKWRVHLLPIKIKWKWIKGNQDSQANISNLDIWAKRNILVDNLAKAHLIHCAACSPTTFYNNGWSLAINHKVLSHIKSHSRKK